MNVNHSSNGGSSSYGHSDSRVAESKNDGGAPSSSEPSVSNNSSVDQAARLAARAAEDKAHAAAELSVLSSLLSSNSNAGVNASGRLIFF